MGVSLPPPAEGSPNPSRLSGLLGDDFPTHAITTSWSSSWGIGGLLGKDSSPGVVNESDTNLERLSRGYIKTIPCYITDISSYLDEHTRPRRQQFFLCKDFKEDHVTYQVSFFHMRSSTLNPVDHVSHNHHKDHSTSALRIDPVKQS